eukprot:5680899-Amphidinium_carterae.2
MSPQLSDSKPDSFPAHPTRPTIKRAQQLECAELWHSYPYIGNKNLTRWQDFPYRDYSKQNRSSGRRYPALPHCMHSFVFRKRAACMTAAACLT